MRLVGAAPSKSVDSVRLDDLSAVPVWARGKDLVGRADPDRSTYGLSSSNTAQIRTALGKSAAGIGSAHILAIGDSETDGYMGSTAATPVDQLNSWPMVLKARLLANGHADGGTGHVKFGGTMATPDPRWTTTGTWTRVGQSYGYSTVVGATATLVFTPGGATNVDIVTTNQSASSTYVVKNSAGTTISSGNFATSGASSLKVISLTGLLDAKTLVITGVTGTNYIFSADIYKTTGLRVSNYAYYGSKATDWASTATYVQFGLIAAAAVPSPDLVVGGLGVNDLAASASNASIYAALTTTFARWSCSKLLISQWQAASFSDANYQAYVAGLYGLCDTTGMGMLDTYERSKGYASLNSRGVMQDATGTHPNQAVHYDTGLAFAQLLTV